MLQTRLAPLGVRCLMPPRALLGFGVTIAALLIFGTDSFLIPTLIVLSVVLLCLQKCLKGGETDE